MQIYAHILGVETAQCQHNVNKPLPDGSYYSQTCINLHKLCKLSDITLVNGAQYFAVRLVAWILYVGDGRVEFRLCPHAEPVGQQKTAL